MKNNLFIYFFTFAGFNPSSVILISKKTPGFNCRAFFQAKGALIILLQSGLNRNDLISIYNIDHMFVFG